MKKFVIAFIVGSLSKGLLMFLLILSNDYTSNHIFAEWLIWFLVFGFADWILLNSIKSEFERINWLKLIPFTYGTFVMILWITYRAIVSTL